MNAAFFDVVRQHFGSLKQSQVDGFNAILEATEGQPITFRAYMLATVWHETAKTMRPIAEYGRGKGKAYGKADHTGKAPFGRGYVQLTWRENYVKADQKLGLGGRLAENYDLAMEPETAAKILVRGCVEGWFTGKRLGDYLPGDYYSARKVVNGIDRAALIAGYAVDFEAALRAGEAVAPAPDYVRPATPAVAPSQGLLGVLIGMLMKLLGKK
jgi:putative chitinase